MTNLVIQKSLCLIALDLSAASDTLNYQMSEQIL